MNLTLQVFDFKGESRIKIGEDVYNAEAIPLPKKAVDILQTGKMVSVKVTAHFMSALSNYRILWITGTPYTQHLVRGKWAVPQIRSEGLE